MTALLLAVAVARRGVAGLLASARVIGWKTLDDPVAGKHASVDRKIPANHKGPHGSVLLSKVVRFVRKVGLVLASINQDQARIATRISVTLVRRVSPPTTTAQAYRMSS